MRYLFHYLATIILIGLYGGQVCPFLDSLTLYQLLLPLVAGLVLLICIRAPLLDRLVERSPYQRQSIRVFWLEFLLFVALGIALMCYNRLAHHFPLVSGMKLVLAMTTLGFFLAIDMSLARERELAEQLSRKRIDLDPELHYFPLPIKLGVFAAANALFITGILFLLINKDLDWFVAVGKEVDLAVARKAIIVEVGFVFLVVLAYVLNLIVSFSENLSIFFHNENAVLSEATAGNLEGAVPVSSNDEFGVMAKHTNLMIAGLKEKTEELGRTRDVTIMSLATLAETRDNETGAHILRTQRYVRVLAENLRKHPDFEAELDPETIELLFKSAPLHDIGKVGIPDNILLKPGKHTDEEFAVMKNHTTLGGDALRRAEESLGTCSFLHLARVIAYNHHEKWDGSGYPKGLAGDDIPLSGRIMAVADVYDALICKRVYKEAFSHDQAKGIIKQGRGSHFDPRVVDAFLAAEQQFILIAAEYADVKYEGEF